MASTINASTVSGIVQSADTSGVLALQTGGTTALSIDTSQNVTFTNGPNLPNTFGFKNRLINGGMVIDQRNSGASGTANGYTVDRWQYYGTQSSKGTWQQNAGAVTPPAGFTSYLGFTSSSAYSVVSSDVFQLAQYVEGLNMADLGWGSANAATITLSFWVRSSLTGTFGGALLNSGTNYCYPFSYTISAANTWEKKTVTVVGPTSGTWLTTNGTGIQVNFGLGVGSTYSGTAGSWAATQYHSCTGATSVVGTNGATWYITGVQLEKGSTATSFDFRDYGRELIMCQRYYQIAAFQGTAASSGEMGCSAFYKVVMRTSPTLGTVLRPSINYTGTDNQVVRIAVGSANVSGVSYGFLSDSLFASIYATGLTSGGVYVGSTTASAEL